MAGPLYLSANGQRVTSADLSIPFYGAPVADLVFPSSTVLTSPVAVVVANLTLTMTVLRQQPFAGGSTARLVGGGGGWQKTLPPMAYQRSAGVPLSMVLRDAARAVGETVSIAADRTVGTFFIRQAGPAARLLEQLAGPEWYVNAAGVTVIGARTGRPITSPATAVDFSGGKGILEVATEDVASWMPANTYSSNTVTPAVTISATRIRTDNEGVLRLEVLTT